MPKYHYLADSEQMQRWLRYTESRQKWFEDLNSYMFSPLDIDYKEKKYHQNLNYDKKNSNKTFSDLFIRANTLHKHADLLHDERPIKDGFHAQIRNHLTYPSDTFNPDLKFKPRKITNPWNETIIADSPPIVDGNFRVGFESEKKNTTKKVKPLTKSQRKQIKNYY